MLDRLFKSLDGLLREKTSLSAKAQKLEQNERQLIDDLSRALSSIGYRVVAEGEQSRGMGRSSARAGGRGLPKRLKCPECDRRFAHPLPMARHMKATHGKRTVARRRRTRTRRKAA